MVETSFWYKFSQVIIYLFVLGLINAISLNAQNYGKATPPKRGDLVQFAKIKGEEWKAEKSRADSLAVLLNIPVSYVDENSRVVILQRLGYNNKPVYYATDNITAAKTIFADKLWTDENSYPSLTGEGIEINVWDGGSILATHQEFQNTSSSRIMMRDKDIAVSNHSTHIAGTMAASGINANARGMASMSTVYGWDLNNDIAEMSIVASEGALVSNHSYGSLCGWYYNTQTERWYWYGDIGISTVEDYEFGFYNETSAEMDFIAWSAPDFLMVKSAGNDRNDTPPDQPVVHYVWDEKWIIEYGAVRDPDGGSDGYDCLSPMSVSKNVLTVGAVDDVKNITAFSSFGPTDDGRIKPDLTANGKVLYSSIGSSNESYGYYDGTSMATASVTGSVALLNQLQEILQPGVKLSSSTVKGLLIHTADEAGSNAGPDYRYGWGILNIKAASDLLFVNSGNGGKNIITGVLKEGEEIIIPVTTSEAAPYLKVTVCWTDPPGQPSSPALNPRDPKLVNDLDIILENVNSLNKYFPWMLDVENPELPAGRGINHADNVEQIYLSNPGSGSFNIRISHFGILTGENQSFSLIISGNSTPTDIIAPQNLTFNLNESSVLLKWNPPESGEPEYYKIYRNDSFMVQITDTSFYDFSIIADILYEYYVTAVYDLNGTEIESIGTNIIKVHPQSFRLLPFIEDFEEEPGEVLIQNNNEGWRWGDSESLGCYYLDFDENATKFIGTDSYTYGRILHVTDVATTAPLKIVDYSDVTVSFDYILNTGIYDAIDELHVVYKLPENDEWTDWVNLPRALNWTSKTFPLPMGAYQNGIQIGFYYDDFYQWGLGAGLDNIKIEGTPVRSVDLSVQSLVTPVSACVLSDNETVSVAIRNTGSEPALPGDIINIRMDLSTGMSVTDIIVLKEALNSNGLLYHQMSTKVNLLETGTYKFDFVISSDVDPNTWNNSFESTVEVFGFPVPQILNQDLTFCEKDPPVLIQVSPIGGILTGSGVSGLYFDPSITGVGTLNITYKYTDPNGCSGTTEKLLTVNENPIVSLGPDQLVNLTDTIHLKPSGNGFSFLWYDGSTEDNLTIIANSIGIGIHNIWVMATGLYNCSSVDTMVLTVQTSSVIPSENKPNKPSIYPNPFRDGFNLVLDSQETLVSVSIYSRFRVVYVNGIPSTYPYFHVPNLPPGLYFLEVQTITHRYVLKILKI